MHRKLNEQQREGVRGYVEAAQQFAEDYPYVYTFLAWSDDAAWALATDDARSLSRDTDGRISPDVETNRRRVWFRSKVPLSPHDLRILRAYTDVEGYVVEPVLDTSGRDPSTKHARTVERLAEADLRDHLARRRSHA